LVCNIMKLRLLSFVALSLISAKGAVIWSIGADDGAADGNGGDGAFNDPATLNDVAFNVSGVREVGGSTDLPGNPANIGGADGDGARDVDDDYYFAGIYTTAPGDAYAPVGIVAESELFYERALTGGDRNMRWHFNVPETVTETDTFTFSIDFYNVSESNTADFSGWDLTFWVDGVQVGEMQPHLDINVDAVQSWDFTVEELGGMDQIGPGFDHYVEIRSTPTGSARWSSLDYVQLEVSSEPKLEDDPNLVPTPAINFGDIKVGSPEVTQAVILKNTGLSQNLIITDITLSGDNADSFSLELPNFPLTIAPGAEAQVNITLSPGVEPQSLAALLSIVSNDTSENTINIPVGTRVFEPFANEGTLWFLGTDDGIQDGEGDATFNDPAFFNGIDFFVSGVQETGEDFLPGNPNNTGGASGGARDIDDDYYFAGSYTTAVDGSGYIPVGEVAANERYYDRALTNGDPNMRWHFNVPQSIGRNDSFTFTIDFYSLNEEFPADESGFDLTFFVDGKQIGEMQPHSDANLEEAQSWDFTLDDLGGTEQLGAGFDHYVEVRSTSKGSARWANLDYAKLDVIAGANQELIITDIQVDKATNDVTFNFQAKIGQTYAVDRSTGLRPLGEPQGWIEISDSLVGESEIQSFTDPGAAATSGKYFYRVREIE